MWMHLIQPVFDPACRRVFHPDRQGALAHLVALEVWNRATGRDLGDRRLVVYRCVRCGGYHVAARRAPEPGPGPARRPSATVVAEDDGPTAG